MTEKKKVQKRWLKSVLHKSPETFRPGGNILYSSAQCLWVLHSQMISERTLLRTLRTTTKERERERERERSVTAA